MKTEELKQITFPFSEISENERNFLIKLDEIIEKAWKIKKKSGMMIRINNSGILRTLEIDVVENVDNVKLIHLIYQIPTFFPDLFNLGLNIYGLKTLPKSFNIFRQLKQIYLGNEYLEEINKDFFSNFSQLKSFAIRGLMKSIPVSIGRLSNLERLQISKSPHLHSLPPSIGNLSTLFSMTIKEVSLKNLPETLGHLHNLQKLTLHDVSLEVLPESLGDCYRLKELDIRNCNNLTTLPDSIGDLHNLESLKIYGCLNLESIPDCITDLPQLKYVYFVENPKLDIPVRTQALLLKKLETFNVDGCKTKWMNP
ncbi:hypothetical protein NEF87_000633 [Candidatus Lokiarchaeum ossiferum]|uniref:Disease resistance R13L4/SHOC-2-like LRR domain-containing protein n=1 Tax=Candidatus Lokiarchaeum ossiferum TaxID=2951803 RepID=A0ABY6HLG1_9ARCH|nr:hypothetical protein NEF87_000633 [Candidatus Lokiarchaeum sp. B-35]